jgi:hypothetical protein
MSHRWWAYGAYAVGSAVFLVAAVLRGSPLFIAGSALFVVGTLLFVGPDALQELRARRSGRALGGGDGQ